MTNHSRHSPRNNESEHRQNRSTTISFRSIRSTSEVGWFSSLACGDEESAWNYQLTYRKKKKLHVSTDRSKSTSQRTLKHTNNNRIQKLTSSASGSSSSSPGTMSSSEGLREALGRRRRMAAPRTPVPAKIKSSIRIRLPSNNADHVRDSIQLQKAWTLLSKQSIKNKLTSGSTLFLVLGPWKLSLFLGHSTLCFFLLHAAVVDTSESTSRVGVECSDPNSDPSLAPLRRPRRTVPKLTRGPRTDWLSPDLDDRNEERRSCKQGHKIATCLY